MAKTFSNKNKQARLHHVRLALPAKTGGPMTSKHGKKHYDRSSSKREQRQDWGWTG